jgi:2-C-methyl-D-erythritol 2,4-cyclodiphosphate synthase
MKFRVGFGQDSHRFAENKGLFLGGAYFDEEKSLQANSDGDVILHALYNAISSALSEGSLGLVADLMCAQGEKKSAAYLEVVLQKMRSQGFTINNLAVSLETSAVKIDPKAQQIKQSLARILEIDFDQIGITATSGEALSDCGRGEGIACNVIVLLVG